eukprot:SAG11_NODE_17289_length_522_cov_2.196217_1_plen_92_part_00
MVETLEYFGALGILVNEVYGMSECTGATTWSTDACHKWGSCGFAMPGCEVAVLLQDKDGVWQKVGAPLRCQCSPLAACAARPLAVHRSLAI